MKLKLDDEGRPALLDGRPVYMHDDGREVAFDAPGTVATIGRLNAEARAQRERAEAAEARLKGFAGIDDPQAARVALAAVKRIDAKELVEAGEIAKAKAEAARAAEAHYLPLVEERDALQRQLAEARIGGAFARSRYIAEKLALPPDIVEARFGRHFAIEDGEVVAKDTAGNRIASAANSSAPADFDEALAAIVQAYPHRDAILKGSGASGSGAPGAGHRGHGRQLSRAQFVALSPAGQAAVAREAAAGKALIID
ncbi:MAG: hypothetical protein KGK11_07770 [Sphingomonadales bacterium]|nr:hypothetical protein [Sphingomonadales bacterium]